MCSDLYLLDLQLKDHVEHSIRAVCLQKLHYVWMFQHVADARFPLQIYVKKRAFSVLPRNPQRNTSIPFTRG